MDPHPSDRWNRFKTVNMAYKREVLEAVGGFDERYFIHREDTDIAWRAINLGFSISWVPRCVVNHPDRGAYRECCREVKFSYTDATKRSMLRLRRV